jgi:hypothetical protein
MERLAYKTKRPCWAPKEELRGVRNWTVARGYHWKPASWLVEVTMVLQSWVARNYQLSAKEVSLGTKTFVSCYWKLALLHETGKESAVNQKVVRLGKDLRWKTCFSEVMRTRNYQHFLFYLQYSLSKVA